MKILIYLSSGIAAVITLGFIYWAVGPRATHVGKVIAEKVYVEVPKAGKEIDPILGTDSKEHPSLEGIKAQK